MFLVFFNLNCKLSFALFLLLKQQKTLIQGLLSII
jgi:hypothetical protein